jgi:hypothetical protein
MCTGENGEFDYILWYGNTLECFTCIFEYYGLKIPNYGNMERKLTLNDDDSVKTTGQVIHFQQVLEAYLRADVGLRAIIANMQGCQLPPDLDLRTYP